MTAPVPAAPDRDEGTEHVTTGNRSGGYPCPYDGTTLTLLGKKPDGSDLGAWCSECKTVWLQRDEVSLRDLDELPEVPDA